MPATLLKKRLWRKRFPVNFVKFLRKPFFIEHLWWLLLKLKLILVTKTCDKVIDKNPSLLWTKITGGNHASFIIKERRKNDIQKLVDK